VKKVNLGSVLLTAGILMFLVGLAVSYDKTKAAAYDNSYNETYEVTWWRVIRNPLDKVDPTNDGKNACMKLGPAEWKVEGWFGDGDTVCEAGETCFEETWTVPNTGWHETYAGLEAASNVYYTVDNEGKDRTGVARCVFSTEDWSESRDKMLFDDHYWIFQAGLYGGYGAHKSRGGLASDESVGFHSWPKAWTITGSVGAGS